LVGQQVNFFLLFAQKYGVIGDAPKAFQIAAYCGAVALFEA